MLPYYVVKHELPFEFVVYDGVRVMLAYLNLDVKFLSRNTSRNDLIKSFAREKVKLRVFLESFPRRIAFTSNCWASLNTDGFISLTAEYIDASWVLYKRILTSLSCLTPIGAFLAKKFLLLLKDWSLDMKVMHLIMDNASSHDLCVGIMKVQLKFLCNGDYFHIYCCVHILNLIVKEGLKDMDEVVSLGIVLSISKALK